MSLMQNDLSVNKKRVFYFLLAIATKQNISHGVANVVGEGAGSTLPRRGPVCRCGVARKQSGSSGLGQLQIWVSPSRSLRPMVLISAAH